MVAALSYVGLTVMTLWSLANCRKSQMLGLRLLLNALSEPAQLDTITGNSSTTGHR